MKKTGGTVAVFHLHDDDTYLAQAIAPFKGRVPIVAYVNKRAWHGDNGDWERAAQTARDAGAEVVLGEWKDEAEHRTFSASHCAANGASKILTPDGDEIVEAKLLDHLLRIADADLADRVRVRFDTYWKSPEYVIRPPEYIRPLMLIDPNATWHRWVRDFEGGRQLVLEEEYGKVHHLSYVGPEERILRKLETWSHKDEVVQNWWRSKWQGWEADRRMAHLHPTHPDAYGFTERIEVPEDLKAVMEVYRSLTGEERTEVTVPEKWPQVSVVIPVCNEAELLKACLASLEECEDLLHEVIAVDNGSGPEVADVCRQFESVTYVRNEENLGFARASNQGAEASTGEVVLFLNSDTVVPSPSLIRLIEPLVKSATVAATGPLSNNCGGFQRTYVTYTDDSRIGLFTEDFTARDIEPTETDLLIGFCLAVRKTALDDVGLFDERFGLGMFEDNDLSYRLRRAGWRLQIAQNSFVHHEGSKTLTKVAPETGELFQRNERKFIEKWKGDLESGFASHLSGLAAERITFDETKKPEARFKEVEKKRDLADISLCMIVRDEERVIADCLKSAVPFFAETIVVDTGSTDRTPEIAESFGAEVRHLEWPDSFAVARNESMRGAKGKWIFWLDADDTLPMECGEKILDTAINAPDDVLGFVVPVQFVDDGPAGGTRVDHVKLFRNLPGVQFEGRIHEQILQTLREHEGQIARCDAYVLHSGYDTSVQGQKKKRTRDEKLLKLDLEDRPDHPFVLFNLGMTAHYTDGHEDAVGWFEKCLNVSRPEESHVRKTYALKAVSHRELGDPEKALATLQEGLGVVGEDPELRFHLGLVLSSLGRYEESLENYRKVNASDTSGYFTSMDVGILGFKLHHNTGGVLCALDRFEEAKTEFLKAMELAPHFMPSAFELFDQSLERGDVETSKFALEHVRKHDGQNKSWAEMSLKFVEKAGGGQNVDASLMQLAETNVHVRKAYSSWLTRNGRADEAAKYWDSLAEQGDAESAYFLGVREVRRGRFADALKWMRRANELNPGHEETQAQIVGLEEALAAKGGE